jgi:lipopolysaccharide exporter
MRFINVKGELFSSTFTYGLTALVKLGSSLVLTRLLNPEAYGVFTILFSIVFMVELLSDVGTIAFLVRHERGNEPRFIHTVWTIRLIRSVMNFVLLYLCAPYVAVLYATPLLTDGLRTIAFIFLLKGAESMSFVLAQREQRSRISNYIELISNILTSLTVIGLAIIFRNYYAFIYGVLIQYGLMTVASYFFYRDVGVRFALERDAAISQFSFARLILPTSMITVALSQYDRAILLKLFDLSILGVYGVASSMITPIIGLMYKNCKVILYARCADYFRSDRATVINRYYSENRRLFLFASIFPAVIAGFSSSLIKLLYDGRYANVGGILMVLALGVIIAAFQNASENLLVASGRTHVALIGNLLRLATTVPFTLIGYHYFGFDGFMWFGLASTIPVLGYFFWEQHRQGLLNHRAELALFAQAFGVFLLCLLINSALVQVIPSDIVHQIAQRFSSAP